MIVGRSKASQKGGGSARAKQRVDVKCMGKQGRRVDERALSTRLKGHTCTCHMSGAWATGRDAGASEGGLSG